MVCSDACKVLIVLSVRCFLTLHSSGCFEASPAPSHVPIYTTSRESCLCALERSDSFVLGSCLVLQQALLLSWLLGVFFVVKQALPQQPAAVQDPFCTDSFGSRCLAAQGCGWSARLQTLGWTATWAPTQTLHLIPLAMRLHFTAGCVLLHLCIHVIRLRDVGNVTYPRWFWWWHCVRGVRSDAVHSLRLRTE
jgi:hypothetical protein